MNRINPTEQPESESDSNTGLPPEIAAQAAEAIKIGGDIVDHTVHFITEKKREMNISNEETYHRLMCSILEGIDGGGPAKHQAIAMATVAVRLDLEGHLAAR